MDRRLPVLVVTTIALMLVVSSVHSQDETRLNLIEDAAGMFNERGYSPNATSFDGSEAINNFNGNLIYTQQLESIPISQNGLKLDLKLTYNGSVGHVSPSGWKRYQPVSNEKMTSLNAPEWILSLNGIAVQVFNFENEILCWESAGYDSTSKDDDVVALINGYHNCYSWNNKQDTAHGVISILMGDGSVQQFMSLVDVDTNPDFIMGYVVVGEYGSFSKEDRSKGMVDSDGTFTLFRDDGSIVRFELYRPAWKTDIVSPTTYSQNDSLVMLLPTSFQDRQGHTIEVIHFGDADAMGCCDTDYSKFGRPPLEQISGGWSSATIDFDWDPYDSSDVMELKLGDSTRWEIHYRDMADSSFVSGCGDKNRAMVDSVVNPGQLVTVFDYTPYRRQGLNIEGPAAFDVTTEVCAGSPDSMVAGRWDVTLHRLNEISYPDGGHSYFTYYEDTYSRWPNPSSTMDTLEVDFGVYCNSVTPDHPCQKSDEFDDLGRDPFFVNIVTATRRILIDGSDTTVITTDSLIFSWDDTEGSISTDDEFETIRIQGSASAHIGGDLVRTSTYTYRQFTENGPYSDLSRDRGWVVKLMTTVEQNTDRIPPERTMTNVWNIADQSFVIDSVKTVVNGVSDITTYDYDWASSSKSNSNIESRSVTDTWGRSTTEYFNTNYFDVDDSTDFYTNALIDTIVTEAVIDSASDVIAKTVNDYYGLGETSGYPGQLKKSTTYEFEIDLVGDSAYSKDSVVSEYEYFEDTSEVSEWDYGSLRLRITPEGDSVVYHHSDQMVPPPGWGCPSCSTTVGPVVYQTLNLDGSIDTVATEFENGPFWHRMDIFKSNTDFGWEEIRSIDTTDVTVKIAAEAGNSAHDNRTVKGGQYVSYILSIGDSCCVEGASHRVRIKRDGAVIDSVVYPEPRNGRGLSVSDSFYISTSNADVAVSIASSMPGKDYTPYTNRGQFTYETIDTVGTRQLDKVSYYRRVDPQGLTTGYVSASGFVSYAVYDDLNRVDQVTLSGSHKADDTTYTVVSPYYTIDYDYDDSPTDGDEVSVKIETFYDNDTTTFPRTAEIWFDGLGRAIRSGAYHSGDSTIYSYTDFDFADRVSAQIDPLSDTTLTEYDILDRLTKTTYPDPYDSHTLNRYTGATDTLLDFPSGFDFRYGKLYCKKFFNENDDSTLEYSDVRGLLRLRERYLNDTALSTYFDYDLYDNLTLVIRPGGDSVQYWYNSLGWLTKEVAADYDTIRYAYDRNGRMTRKQDGVIGDDPDMWLYYEYDPLGRVTESGLYDSSETDFEAIQHYFYDQEVQELSQGRLSLTYNEDTRYGEEYSYDARGRLAKQINYYDADLVSTRTDSVYIKQSQRGTTTDTMIIRCRDSVTVNYILTKFSVASPRSIAAVYWNDSMIASCSGSGFGGQAIVDGSFRCADGDTVTIFTNLDRWDNTVTALAGYERYAQHQRLLDPDWNQVYEIGYEYNLADQVTKIVYPTHSVGCPDSIIVTYHYDDMGRLESVGDESDDSLYASMTYTDRSEIESMVYYDTTGNTLQCIDYYYNERGWLDSINPDTLTDTAAPGDLFVEKLIYYADSSYNGNVMEQLLCLPSGWGEHVYSYDDLDRLTFGDITTVSINKIMDSILYDDNGNILTHYSDLFGARTVSYGYPSGVNQLTSLSNATVNKFTYDDAGRQATDSADGTVFHYDDFGQLEKITWDNAEDYDTLTFYYNANGERVYKHYLSRYWDTCPGPPPHKSRQKDPPDSLCLFRVGYPVHYIRSKGKVLAEFNITPDSCLAQYIYAGDQRIAMYDLSRYGNLGDRYFYLNDHLGSARIVVKDDGTIQDEHWYSAFGGIFNETVTLDQAYRYTGKPLDQENGLDLYYYGARYYDPHLRRFPTVDPAHGSYPDWSPYAYALDNPLKYTDPDGRAVETPIDVISVGLSAMDLYDDPSLANAGWLALDIACAAIPFVPAVGVIRHAGKIDDALKAMKRGLKTEAKVLDAEGIAKNTKRIDAVDPKTKQMGKTAPDAILPDGTTVEVKDRAYLSDSPQLRRQSEITKNATGGKKQAVVINARKGGKVSGPVDKRMNVRPPENLD